MADITYPLFLLHKSVAQAPNTLNDALNALESAVVLLRETTLTSQEKFELLEHIHRRYGNQFPFLYESIRKHDTLPFEKITSSARVHQLQQALVVHYLQVLTDIKNIMTPTDIRTLAITVSRAITYLRDIQLSCYQLYAPLPDRWWFQLHCIYRKAEQHNIHEDKLHLLARDLPQTTLSHSYQSALLFGAANTARLTSNEIALLPELLNEWSDQMTLHSTPNNIDLYGVILLSDCGPVYQTLLKNKPEKNVYRTFDITPFISTLSSPSSLVEHLKKTLGSKPTRRSVRVPCNGNVQLKNNHQELHASEILLCKKNNMSNEGYCLEQNKPIALQVGEHIQINDLDKHHDWQPAVVRWLRYQKDHSLQMGVQLST